MKCGDVARDVETGFVGVVDARLRSLDDYGELWRLQPQRSARGKRAKAKWFFPSDLEVIVSLPVRPRRKGATA